MNAKALKTLEFDKILVMLEKHAGSPLGKKRCRDLLPSSDLGDIRALQAQTTDAVSRHLKKGAPSFGSARDVRASLKCLEVGSTLSISELLNIASLLENTARAKSYGRHDNNEDSGDSLDVFFNALEPLTPLSSEIRRCILSEDEISDDASPALRQIRRQIAANGDRIHSQLNSMINGSLRSALQDAVITMRDGRYCIPVKAEYRGSVPGMVHDQSATGATVFIEPMAIVKLNNEIRELEIKEQKEIEKILAALSEEAGQHIEEILCDLENMVELDFIFARASLSLEMKGSEPIFNTEGRVQLRKARHPLLEKHRVVPIDIRLGQTFDLLIITGPNTGGKTVSLKTLGLLTIMGESGLHIPALDRSELAVFEEVYADIGDEQSIEQSLSTFSAHMTNIVSFLEKANEKSLVLFDELGAGTDPTEGAALAIAILSFLHRKHVRTMATTHYSELKVFALSTDGVENASCEFDIQTLRPTYRLLIGVPGKSNAFAISGKLGLPSYIIEEAQAQISEQDESFEDVLTSLEQNRIAMENDQRAIAYRMEQLERKEKDLLNREKTLEKQKDQIIRKANDQAHTILQEAKDYADQTMKDFRKFGKNSINSGDMERRRNELREKMNKTQKSNAIRPAERSTKELKPSDLQIGDGVKVLSLNLKGTVSTRPDSKGYLFVRCGIIRSKVHISDLELLNEPDVTLSGKAAHVSTGKVRMSKAMSVSSEIKLIGKTVDEAVAELDKYLDDAYIAHLASVRVVHGKGTGALRKGIHQYLRTQSHIKEFHLAEYGEGDAGVTIVTFKK
ncbi:MAG: endonuclease MutS2 [Eubacteriales bacterium]|nr:endonuclease MutS2 [Eubacteriales bacterium]